MLYLLHSIHVNMLSGVSPMCELSVIEIVYRREDLVNIRMKKKSTNY